MASLQHVPKEFTSTLSTLQDKAVPCHIKALKQVFVENFGKDLSDIYVTFDEQPIASASIAQVHRATLADGQEVAVKVCSFYLLLNFKGYL
jgi:aarF domain-containing kinase